MTQQQTNYHHLFGLMVQDFFRGTPCEVELERERDLSVKSQFLDLLILHKPDIVLDRALPDGLLHLFSASKALLQYGRRNCRISSPETSILVADLFAGYDVEGLTVPITMEEFIRQAERRAVLRAPVGMRLEGLTPRSASRASPPSNSWKS